MVRIHQGALIVIPMVFSDLLGAIFPENQRLCADLTQAHPDRGGIEACLLIKLFKPLPIGSSIRVLGLFTAH